MFLLFVHGTVDIASLITIVASRICSATRSPTCVIHDFLLSFHFAVELIGGKLSELGSFLKGVEHVKQDSLLGHFQEL